MDKRLLLSIACLIFLIGCSAEQGGDPSDQATAPGVGEVCLGGTQAVRDQTSLRMLAGHAEDMLEDVARLADRSADGETVPSVSLAVEIALPDEGRREAFLEDLRHTFEDLARRYSTEPADGPTDDRERFRFTLACYPTSDEEAT